jgi:hypothetical protein
MIVVERQTPVPAMLLLLLAANLATRAKGLHDGIVLGGIDPEPLTDTVSTHTCSICHWIVRDVVRVISTPDGILSLPTSLTSAARLSRTLVEREANHRELLLARQANT